MKDKYEPEFNVSPFPSSLARKNPDENASNPPTITDEILDYLHARHMQAQKTLKAHNIQYIDAFHGEMGFGVHANVRDTLAAAESAGYDVTDIETGSLKSKTTPRHLQTLVAENLCHRWAHQIPSFRNEHIVLTPYSSLLALESTLRSLRRINPGKTGLLVPDGHYKSLVRHISAAGLVCIPIKTNLADNCRLGPRALRAAIADNRENVAGLLLTIPGNPLLATYSDAQLTALATVLVEEDVYTVVDAAFELVVAPYKPLAAVTLPSGARMYDRVAMTTGISKSHHATGPEKIGAVVTGSLEWRQFIALELSHQFQRETSARAEIVLQHTPPGWVDRNADSMHEGQLAANDVVQEIECKHERTVFIEVGRNLEGPFKLLTVSRELLDNVGIFDSAQLQDYLLLSGLDTVPGIRMGFDSSRGHAPVVRVNVHAPRIGNIISSEYRPQFHQALHKCADALVSGQGYSELCKSFNLEPCDVRKGRIVPTADTALGVVREGSKEHRVALTPAAIYTLRADKQHPVSIVVESGAGVRAGFSDDDFIKAGAMIDSRANVLANATGLVTIKPCKTLTHAELASLRSDQYVVGFYGNYGRERIAHDDITVRTVSLDDGTSLSPGVHSPLSAVSLFAGQLAFDHAVELSVERFPGQLTSSSPHGHALILGSGHAARAAAARALTMRLSVTMVCTSEISDKELASHVNEVRVPREDLDSAREIIMEEIQNNPPQVVVAAASKRFAQAPKLLTLDHVLQLDQGEGTVIVDLAASAGGNAYGAKLDTISRPAPRVVVANESNYPTKRPQQASSAFAAAMVRFVRERKLLRQ